MSIASRVGSLGVRFSKKWPQAVFKPVVCPLAVCVKWMQGPRLTPRLANAPPSIYPNYLEAYKKYYRHRCHLQLALSPGKQRQYPLCLASGRSTRRAAPRQVQLIRLPFRPRHRPLRRLRKANLPNCPGFSTSHSPQQFMLRQRSRI